MVVRRLAVVVIVVFVIFMSCFLRRNMDVELASPMASLAKRMNSGRERAPLKSVSYLSRRVWALSFENCRPRCLSTASSSELLIAPLPSVSAAEKAVI